MPSAANSTYNIWYMSGSSDHTTISLASASYGNLYAYFRLDPPDLGNLSLTKTTEDGKNLSGWQFSIYSNSACTSLVSGPHRTDSSGKNFATGLKPGTYYVKEIGHSTSSINALYYCSSTNPQSGHADVDMTKHYLHVQDPVRLSAIAKFDEAFFGKNHQEHPNIIEFFKTS